MWLLVRLKVKIIEGHGIHCHGACAIEFIVNKFKTTKHQNYHCHAK